MLGKILVFLFSFLGVFALIMGMMPSDFIYAGTIYNPDYRDAEIQEMFDANSLLVYSNMANDTMVYPYSSLIDGPNPPDWEAGLPENQFLEVGWGLEEVGPFYVEAIIIRHRQRNWFGPLSWYSTLADCKFYTQTGESLGYFLFKSSVEDYYSTTTNSSAFYAKGGSIQTSFLVSRNDTSQTIGDNWDDGHLKYYLSYQINWNMTGINAWSIVGQLLSFQAPSFGIPGVWGSFMSTMIAIPMWAGIAYVCYKIVMGIIPWVSGGSGD